jgi:sugar lactone lactonase YvrE
VSARAVVAVPGGDILGENPVWSAREQALYWVDIRAPALHRFAPAADHHRTWRMPELCGGVALTADGVIVALRHGLAKFDPRSGTLTRWRDIETEQAGNRLNELRCDREGRLWVGSMRDFGLATTGSLYCVSPSGQADAVLREITIPNSLGWSPDGHTMYFADTAEGSIRAYGDCRAHRTLRPVGVLVAAEALPGKPDGCCVDAAGHVWTTRFGAGLIVRVAPDGRVSGEIALPTTQPTACTLGGSDLLTLFITTARQRLDDAELRSQPEAGHLFAATVDQPGIAEREFGSGGRFETTWGSEHVVC